MGCVTRKTCQQVFQGRHEIDPNLINVGIRKLLISLNFIRVLQFCFNKGSLFFSYFLDEVIFIWYLLANNFVGREGIETKGMDEARFVMTC